MKKITRKKIFDGLFKFAGIYNIFLGIYGILASIIDKNSSKYFGMEKPPSLVFFHLSFGLIIIFGLLFFLISYDLSKYKRIIPLLVCEKLLGFITVTYYFILKDLNIIGFFIGFIDLIFAIIFLITFLCIRNE